MAVLEFVLAQASTHDISDQALDKDLTQMGVAIENSDTISKVYAENQD